MTRSWSRISPRFSPNASKRHPERSGGFLANLARTNYQMHPKVAVSWRIYKISGTRCANASRSASICVLRSRPRPTCTPGAQCQRVMFNSEGVGPRTADSRADLHHAVERWTFKIKGEVIWVHREEDRSFVVGSTFTRLLQVMSGACGSLLQHLRGEDRTERLISGAKASSTKTSLGFEALMQLQPSSPTPSRAASGHACADLPRLWG